MEIVTSVYTTVPILLVMSVLLGNNSFELHPLRRNKFINLILSNIVTVSILENLVLKAFLLS